MTPVSRYAVEALDLIDERIMGADEDGISYDHAAGEAICAIAGCFDADDLGACNLLLQAVVETLLLTPLGAPNGVFQMLFAERVAALTGGRCRPNANAGVARLRQGRG